MIDFEIHPLFIQDGLQNQIWKHLDWISGILYNLNLY